MTNIPYLGCNIVSVMNQRVAGPKFSSSVDSVARLDVRFSSVETGIVSRVGLMAAASLL
jgi:hypothetical protein